MPHSLVSFARWVGVLLNSNVQILILLNQSTFFCGSMTEVFVFRDEQNENVPRRLCRRCCVCCKVLWFAGIT